MLLATSNGGDGIGEDNNCSSRAQSANEEGTPGVMAMSRFKNLSMASPHAQVIPASSSSRVSSAAGKIMSLQNLLPLLAILLMGGLLGGVEGLKCVMCGQYNEGVGSITPCLNYSDKNANLYVKECSKKSEKFCVKYVSELSTVRDCATECVEKEIWETQTYCCNEDGCNGSNSVVQYSNLLFALPLIIFMLNSVIDAFRR